MKYFGNKINVNASSNDVFKNNNKNNSEKNNDYFIYNTLRGNNSSNSYAKKDINRSMKMIPHSRTKKKKILSKNFSSSFIKQSNNSNETYFIRNINNSSFGENVNNFIFNINEDSYKKANLYNIIDKFSSNRTISSEKIKIQKKLEEYHNLIDKKLNKLRNKAKYYSSTNSVKTTGIRLKLFSKEGKVITNNYKKNCESIYDLITNKIKCTSNISQRNINRKKI